jgi:hypothetical protein
MAASPLGSLTAASPNLNPFEARTWSECLAAHNKALPTRNGTLLQIFWGEGRYCSLLCKIHFFLKELFLAFCTNVIDQFFALPKLLLSNPRTMRFL